MTRIQKQTLLYMVLTAILFVGGYFFLRAAYHLSEPTPFTQEIVLVILGTLATVLITAILLNKQTEVELTKEQNVKFIELKSSIYLELLNYLEQALQRPEISENDIIELQFLTHKLAISASPDVLNCYRNLLNVFTRAIGDHRFDYLERTDLHQALAHLTVEIRKDLIGDLDLESRFSGREIEHQVMENNAMTSKTYGEYHPDQT